MAARRSAVVWSWSGGNSASFWLGLQMDFDLDVAEDVLALRIKKEVRQLDVA
jgi:plasmid maintenance system antidote protein VapI